MPVQLGPDASRQREQKSLTHITIAQTGCRAIADSPDYSSRCIGKNLQHTRPDGLPPSGIVITARHAPLPVIGHRQVFGSPYKQKSVGFSNRHARTSDRALRHASNRSRLFRADRGSLHTFSIAPLRDRAFGKRRLDIRVVIEGACERRWSHPSATRQPVTTSGESERIHAGGVSRNRGVPFARVFLVIEVLGFFANAKGDAFWRRRYPGDGPPAAVG